MRLSPSSAVFLVVLLALAGLAVWGVLNLLEEPEPSEPSHGEEVLVTIPRGATSSDVAEILAAEGVVDSEWRFGLSARFDARANRIQAGDHVFREGMSDDEALDVLAEGPLPPPTWRVTIPEGLTVDQTLERIAAAEDSPFSVEDLQEALLAVPLPEWVPEDLPEGAQPFEGLLAPATYEYQQDVSPVAVLRELVVTTSERLDELDPANDWEPYELLTVASLIEREVRVAEERELVAAVVANRLDAGQRLQIDATVQYAQGEHQERLLFEDLEIDSAWNTYEEDGLPPTPIAAPGQAALAAAAEPADVDYRFYVVCDTDTGEHAFAETNDAHDANVARYREIQDDGGRFCDDL